MASDLGLSHGPDRTAAGEYPPDFRAAGLAHVVASHTGHHVHLDDSELVVRVIRRQLMQLDS